MDEVLYAPPLPDDSDDSKLPDLRRIHRFNFTSLSEKFPILKEDKALHPRKFNEFREIYIKISIVDSVTGSAYFRLGNTQLLCTIHGPYASSKKLSSSVNDGHINFNVNLSPFVTSQANKISQLEDKFITELLYDAIMSIIQLEKYPISTIEINLNVLELDGSFWMAALTCIGLALSDAGIEIYDCVTAFSIYCILDTDNFGNNEYTIAVDLTADELEEIKERDYCVTHIGFFPNMSSIFYLRTLTNNMCVSSSLFSQLLNMAEVFCRTIFEEIQKCLYSSHLRKLKKVQLLDLQKSFNAFMKSEKCDDCT